MSDMKKKAMRLLIARGWSVGGGEPDSVVSPDGQLRIWFNGDGVRYTIGNQLRIGSSYAVPVNIAAYSDPAEFIDDVTSALGWR